MDEMLQPNVEDAAPTVPFDRVYAACAGAAFIVACVAGLWAAAIPHPLWKLLTIVGFIPITAGCFVRYVALVQQRGCTGPLPFIVNRRFVCALTAAASVPLILATWYGPLPHAHQLALLCLAVSCDVMLRRAPESEKIFARERGRRAARLSRDEAVLLGIVAAFFIAGFAAMFCLL